MATEKITVTIVGTNAPTTNGMTLTGNASVRTFTNSVSAPSSQVLTNTTIVGSMSNLYFQIISTAFAGPTTAKWDTNATITIEGALGEAMNFSAAGFWGTVSYSTQYFSSGSLDVRVPMSAEPASVRTNMASLVVKGINDHSTEAFATNSVAMGNFTARSNASIVHPQIDTGTASNLTTITVNLIIATNGQIMGGWFTGGSISNLSWLSGIIGNLTNGTLQGTKLTNVTGRWLGGWFSNDSHYALVVTGFTAYSSMVMPTNFQFTTPDWPGVATTFNDLAGEFGNFNAGAHKDEETYLRFVDMLNSGQFHVDVAGSGFGVFLEANLAVYGWKLTNSTFGGSNTWTGDIAYTSGANSAMINGVNANITLATNVYIELSGWTTIGQVNGLHAGRDGEYHELRLSGAVTNVIVNEVSGTWATDATAANRIVTGTGGDLYLTNNPSWLGVKYREASSRWEVVSVR